MASFYRRIFQLHFQEGRGPVFVSPQSELLRKLSKNSRDDLSPSVSVSPAISIRNFFANDLVTQPRICHARNVFVQREEGTPLFFVIIVIYCLQQFEYELNEFEQ